MNSKSFSAAYPQAVRSGVSPFIDEWGEDLMILKRIYGDLAGGYSIFFACRQVHWSIFKFIKKRFSYKKRDIMSAPRTPRVSSPGDPEIARITPFNVHHCHPDHLTYSPYPVSVEQLRELFAFNEWRGQIFDGFVRFMDELKRNKVRGYIWIGGSYISEKENPSDMDLLLVVTGGPILPWKTRAICFDGPINRVYAKSVLKCDPFVIDCRNDVAHLPRAVAFWVHHFSFPGRAGDPAKGFFEVELIP